MDLTKPKIKFTEDRLAEEQSSFKMSLTDGEDPLVDTTMYRVWTYNPNIDLSFLRNEAEATVARWKARSEEDLLSLSKMAAGEEPGEEVSSRAENPREEPPADKTPSRVTKRTAPSPKK